MSKGQALKGFRTIHLGFLFNCLNFGGLVEDLSSVILLHMSKYG